MVLKIEYAHANSVTGIDPSGLFTINLVETLVVSALVALLATLVISIPGVSDAIFYTVHPDLAAADAKLLGVRQLLVADIPRIPDAEFNGVSTETYIGGNSGPLNALAHGLAVVRAWRQGSRRDPQWYLDAFQAREGPDVYGTATSMDRRNNEIGIRIAQIDGDPVEQLLNEPMWFFVNVPHWPHGELPGGRLVYGKPIDYLDSKVLEQLQNRSALLTIPHEPQMKK